MLKLWLDDDIVHRKAPDGWIHVTTAEQAKEYLLTGNVAEIDLDHDLATCGQECTEQEDGKIKCTLGPPLLDYCPCACHQTGYDLVKWMAEMSIWPRDRVRCHSANPVGRDNIMAIVHRYGPY